MSTDQSRAHTRSLHAFLWAPVALGLLLAGCGVSSGGAASGMTTPSATLTSGKEATPVQGVTIVVEKATYARAEAIRATVANHLATSVFASDGRAACTILDLEVKTAQGWETATVTPCAQSDAPQPVQIAGSATRSATIAATGDGFPVGTYRLALSYTTIGIPPSMAGVLHEGLPRPLSQTRQRGSPLTTVYSSAFEIR